MSKWPIDFSPGITIPTGAPVETPLQAAHAIVNGYIPDNFVSHSRVSDNFRDATLANILVIAAGQNKFEDVLNTFSIAMQSSPDNSIRTSVFAEYMAAIAFSWEHQELAGKIIMRGEPQNTSPFLWSIVSAIKKNLPSAMFASLIMSMGDSAERKWQEEQAILKGVSVAASSNP